MMRKSFAAVLICVLCAAMLSACGGRKAAAWQEQYDLGVRYLSEGNYEEAIIAFTAAIEIDPKQAPAYVGRGGAYVGSGDTAENLTAAQADYEKAIELDGTIPKAYLGLAEVYILRGDYEMAEQILRDGLERVGENSMLSSKLSEVEAIIEESRIFTEDVLKPEELQIAGRPFWELNLEDVQAQYESILNDFNPLYYTQNTLRRYEAHATYSWWEGNTGRKITNCIIAEQRDGDAGINYFAVHAERKDVEVPLDMRGICIWDSCADVLAKLGLQESWIEEFLALGPGKDIGFSNKGQKWITTEFEAADTIDGSDAALRRICFDWDEIPCQTISHINSFIFSLDFDENDQLTDILLWVHNEQ